MQPHDTVDSAIDFANPYALGILAFFALIVLIAVSRWVWLLVLAILKRRLTRKEWFEFFGLSLPLGGLAFFIGYTVFVFYEAYAWSE